MWLELIAIGVLILLNGFFACAELAIVNPRRSRIKQLVEEKNVQARLVQAFQEDSERFLATTQIGITVAGASAAAMGGVVAIDHLKPVFEAIPLAFVQAWAEPIAVGIVVLIISYFSLVLGELVPKILALKNPERLALLAARPLAWFARVAAWCIRPLALTSRGILRLLGKAAQGEKVFISAEEILLLMQEGQEKGVFDKTEQELIHSVFEFTDMSVREVMVPRPKMCAIAVDMPTPDLLKYIDENVGEIQDEYDTEEKPVERLKDGAILVDASMPVKDLVSEYGLQIPPSPEYETLGGFVTYQIQALPRGGEVFYHGDYKFTVVDLGDRRVSKVKVERIAEQSKVVKEPVKTGPK